MRDGYFSTIPIEVREKMLPVAAMKCSIQIRIVNLFGSFRFFSRRAGAGSAAEITESREGAGRVVGVVRVMG